MVAVDESQLTEKQARQLVDRYLADALGPAYVSSTTTDQAERWSFLVQYQDPRLPQPCIVGRVFVNGDSFTIRNGEIGSVIPLTSEQLQEICETAAWEVARRRGELARNEKGYLSRHQARRLARRWLDQHLSMKFGATGGQWVSRNPPVWQFSIEFNLQDVHLESLGVMTVDAQTGAVTPLSLEQLDHLREHVRVAIQLHSQTAAI